VSIYRLNYDYDNYPRIDVSTNEDEDKLPEGKLSLTPNIEKLSYWVTLNGSLEYVGDASSETPCPELSDWFSSLVLSRKAKDKIGDRLEKYGELLPLSIDGEERFYFNILNTSDAIDPFNTKRLEIDGIDFGIKQIVFLEHEVKDLFIFMTEYDGFSYLYCTDAFKDMIEGSGLSSGWTFHKNLRED